MAYSIRNKQNYLECDVSGPLIEEEFRKMLEAIRAEAMKTGCRRVLFNAHDKPPQFKRVQANSATGRNILRPEDGFRMAIVTDAYDLSLAAEYATLVWRQQGSAMNCFRNKQDAVQWLEQDNSIKSPGLPNRSADVVKDTQVPADKFATEGLSAKI
jgi:hypothetical protein